MPDVRRIAAVLRHDHCCERAVLRGINQYAATLGNWHVQAFIADERAAARMKGFGPEGLILGPSHAMHTYLPPAVAVRHAVHVLGLWRPNDLLRVDVDDVQVGQMAAQHLLECGVESFAAVGLESRLFSELRLKGFCGTIEGAGLRVITHQVESSNEMWLKDLLTALPRPAGLFAVTDAVGIRAIHAAREMGIGVPHELAVIGVNNDELAAEMSLTSVSIPLERIGQEAARRLDKMLAGESASSDSILLSPVGVISRSSTDLVAISDPSVAGALRFIRENANRPIGVEDVVQSVAVARRTLEARFRSVLGRSPLEEIHRVRIQRAKQLLAQTRQSVAFIAEQCGYSTPAWLTRIFQEQVHMTPSMYRRQFRRE